MEQIMKKMLFTLMILAVLMSGCDVFLGPDEPVGGGSLSIGFGTGDGRAAFSEEELADFHYKLTLTGPDGETITASITHGERFSRKVALGEWRIAVEAYNSDNIPTGSGNTVIQVKAGNNRATVEMIAADTGSFVAVTGISGVPAAGTAGIPLTLTGTAAPENATNQTITWSVKNYGTTGATISGSVLSTTAAGTVVVTATITNGVAVGTDYTQDFSIIINTIAGQLAAALNAITPDSATASGSTVTLAQDVTLTGTLTVPATVTLDLVTNHKSITLGNNAVLTVNGEINAEAAYEDEILQSGNGRLLVDSAIGTPATVNGSGVVHLKTLGKLIQIESGKEFILDGDVTLDGLMTQATAGTKGVVLPSGYADGSDNNQVLLLVCAGSKFTMNGGTIGYNRSVGIFVDGEFNMHGGMIRGNVNASEAGGIYVGSGRLFTMYGGQILDNHATRGGGVYVTAGDNGNGTFIMAGGTVYGSSAGSDFANTVTGNGAALYCPFANAYWGDLDGNVTTAIPSKSNQNGTLRGGNPGTVE
jgi:hypothetical protein